MAVSKATLKAKFLELGGDPADLPENLEDITAADIQEKIDALEEAAKLKAQLQGGTAPAAPAAETEAPATVTPAAPDDLPEAPAPQAHATNNEQEGATFTLTGSASWSSARLPGKRYTAGSSFTPETEAEAAILRSSGRFTVGG